MRRGFLIVFCFISSLSLRSQVELKPVISISNTNSSYVLREAFNTDYIFQSFYGINSKFGLEYSMNKGSFYAYGIYQYSGSYFRDSFFDYLFDGKLFKNRSHFLGGEIEYQFYNSGKRFRPFISLMLSKEVSTNSEYAYLSEGFAFIFSPMSYESILTSGYPIKVTYYSHFYMETPFIGSLTGGFVFRAKDNFSIKLGAGYGLRIMKTKYTEWKEDEDIYEKLKKVPSETHYFHMLDVQLGLAYSFSFKNKSKPQ